MVHRIQEYKPSLKQHGLSVDTSDAKPALAYDPNSDIIMFSEESWLSIVLAWVKSGFLFIVSAIVIFAVLYVTLAVSLFFITVVDGEPTFVSRGTFLGGEPALQDKVLASSSEKEQADPISRLKYAFIGVPDSSVMQIASGPLDSITANNGIISVSGNNSAQYEGVLVNAAGEPISVNSQDLSGDYLALCLSGSCTPDTYIVVDGQSIFGEVQNVKEGI